MSAAPDGPAPEPLGPGQIFFSFRGRISRRTWWLYGALACTGLTVTCLMLLQIAGLNADAARSATSALMLWPLMATSAKRWHDIGRSGWWALATVPPVLGWVTALVFNGCLPGARGANRFGGVPAVD